MPQPDSLPKKFLSCRRGMCGPVYDSGCFCGLNEPYTCLLPIVEFLLWGCIALVEHRAGCVNYYLLRHPQEISPGYLNTLPEDGSSLDIMIYYLSQLMQVN